MKKNFAGVLMALATVCAASAQAGVSYSVTDIGTLSGKTTATALNDLGQVAGYSVTAIGNTVAFLSSQGAIQSLGTLGGANSYAYGVNNDGTVVGNASLATGNALMTHAFSFSNGTMTDIAPAAAGLQLRSYATGINNAGQIVGYTVNPDYADMAVFYVSKGATTVMQSPIGGAYYAELSGINNTGVAVGAAGARWPDFNEVHAFTYSLASGASTGTDIAKTDHWASDAYAINDNGVVVGSMEVGNWAPHAFIYANGSFLDLGTGGKQYSTAKGINNAGQVVGYVYDQGREHSRAFLYANGSMSYLDALVDPTLGLTFESSNAINQLGQIIANASNGHAYLLSPVPEPDARALLLAGIGLGLVVSNKRRRATRLPR